MSGPHVVVKIEVAHLRYSVEHEQHRGFSQVRSLLVGHVGPGVGDPTQPDP